MTGERKNKWKRSKDPDPIALQQRDLAIVLAVYEFGFLTREQIQRFFGIDCVTRANIRLRKLFDNLYLSRRYLPVTSGSSKAIYFLGPKGVTLISEQTGMDPLEIRKRQKNHLERREMFLDHDLAVNEVRIAFHQVQGQNGFKLDRWIGSIDCLQEYIVHNPRTNREFRKVFRPDGYFRYSHDGRLFGCFLEVDRSTMSNTRFKSKIQVYLDYAQFGLYQQRYGLNFFRVLVITKTTERLVNLKSATETLTDKIFWFTEAANITREKIFDDIWERPGRDERFSLLE